MTRKLTDVSRKFRATPPNPCPGFGVFHAQSAMFFVFQGESKQTLVSGFAPRRETQSRTQGGPES
jgi:hypothetical protein